jgi:SOS-response transcriptional repressor LexA
MTNPPKKGLTRRQKDVYDFIVLYHRHYGIFPTFSQIRKGQIQNNQVMKEVKSKSSVRSVLTEIERRGWIVRDYSRHQAMQIL